MHITLPSVCNGQATKTSIVELYVEESIKKADAPDLGQEATAALNMLDCDIIAIEKNIETSRERQLTLSSMVFRAALEGNQDRGLVSLYQISILTNYMKRLENHVSKAMIGKEQLSGAITAW